MPGVIDEKLQQLTDENAQLKAEVERLKAENEQLQVDYANKIAAAKVDYETKEIKYKKEIRDLTLALEMRNSNERQKIKDEDKNKKSVNAIWEEITGKTK